MKFAVTVITPPGYIHSAAFKEVAETIHYGLQSLGHDSVLTTEGILPGRQHIVLGSNLLPAYPLPLAPDAILYNLEQVYEGSMSWFRPELIDIFRHFPLWDYSQQNAVRLEELGVKVAHVLPIGYVKELTRIQRAPDPDIDVLFCGSINPRRQEIVTRMQAAGLRVFAAFGVYGKKRDELISRAKLLLNVHFYDAKVLEMVRISYLLANHCAVLSEHSSEPEEDEKFAGGVAFADYDNLVQRACELIDAPDERERLARRGFEIISARPAADYLRAALAQTGHLSVEKVEAESLSESMMTENSEMAEANAVKQRVPEAIDQALELGIEQFQSGKLSEAEACFQHVMKSQPDDPNLWRLLGVISTQQQHYATAIERLKRAIELNPKAPHSYSTLGVVYLKQQLWAEAIECFQTTTRLQPSDASAHSNLGNAYQKQGMTEEAKASYQRALQLKPDLHQIHINLGSLYQQAGQLDEAAASYQRALQLQPDLTPVHAKLGLIYREQGKFDEAIAAHQRALKLQPDSYQIHTNLGNIYQEIGKLDEAAASYQQAQQLQSDFYPAHANLGTVLKHQGKLAEAVASYQRALQLQPDFPPAHFNLGSAYQELGELEEAISSYQRALELQPDYPEVLKEYVWVRRGVCSWDGLPALEQVLTAACQSDRWTASPLPMLAIDDDPVMQFAAAKNFRANYIRNSVSPLWTGQRYQHDKIRLAYLSADYHEHATAYLMAELFEHHDRSRFELVAISFGPDDRSPMRQRLEQAFDRFIDVRQRSHLEAAQQMRNLEIDIAIDLKGYTKDCRPHIFAHRPAPIQVNYLGYPSTMGADFIDYILVDPFVVPPDQQPFFTEKLVHLPDCYQVNDRKRVIANNTPSRQECSLPAEGFVFCSFNNANKITPTVFNVWMRLLKAVPGSVLWLLSRNKSVEENLRKEAHSRGVNPDRLVFAHAQNLPEHLARQRLADLFLDTLPYNAHTTASDALWAGLPAVTCAGQSFAARVAGSLLHAIGLPELVTYSLEDYEALALKLATQPDVLQDINRKLARNRPSAPLFDCDRFRRNIEAAYTQMWSLWQQGEQPRAFAVTSSTETFQAVLQDTSTDPADMRDLVKQG